MYSYVLQTHVAMLGKPIWLGIANAKEIKCQGQGCNEQLRLASSSGEWTSFPFDDSAEPLDIALNIVLGGMYLSLDNNGIVSDANQDTAATICQLNCDNNSNASKLRQRPFKLIMVFFSRSQRLSEWRTGPQ